MTAFLGPRSRFLELCLALVSLWHVCLASPLHMKGAGWSINSNSLELLKRGASIDPSCPAGWLCEQQNCPANLYCPPGEVCVNFEGTPACVPSGTSWCAVNPSNLEAVKCVNGICCHGNCYTAEAVCCTNDDVECKIGDACNVCRPGQTCSTGTSTCIGGDDGEISTTTKVSISTTTTISVPLPPLPPTDTTTTVTVTSVTSQTSISTTTALPSPTVVASWKSFVSQGCFEDAPDNRMLVADSIEDHGKDGMTVEKCTAFAKKGNWQYAGVEFGGQCFVGNSLHSTNKAAQSDCSQACAGAPSEVCGNGNRLQLYRDIDWRTPSTQQLIDQLTQYNKTLSAGRSAIQKFQDDMRQYQKDLGASKRKRQAGGILTPILRLDLEHIHGDFSMLKALQATIKNEEQIILRLFKIAQYLDLPRPVKGPPVDSEMFEELNTDVVESATSAMEPVVSAATVADAVIGPALENAVIPAIDVATDIAVATSALTAIGVWVDVSLATGIFAAIVSILSRLVRRGPDEPDDPKTITTRTISTRTTTTTTTTQTTAAATSMVVLTDQGTSLDDFHALIKDLDVAKDLMTEMVYPNLNFQAFAAPLNETQQVLVRKSNIANVMVENVITPDPDYIEYTVTPKTNLLRGREETTKSGLKVVRVDNGQPPGAPYGPHPRLGKRAITTQPNSPSHLKILSRQSSGAVPEYTYDDAAAGRGVNIYALDSGLRETHQDFTGRRRRSQVVQHAGPSAIDEFGHGTSIISVAGGNTYGVAKGANLIMVKAAYDQPTPDQNIPLSRTPAFGPETITNGLMFIINDVKAQYQLGTLQRGKAVINISLGFGHRFGFDWDNNRSFFVPLLADIYANDIVLVTSAGNVPQDIKLDELKQHGGKDTPMIIVGGVVADTLAVWPQSGFGDALTVRTQSTDISSAGNVTDTQIVTHRGTSQAAAAVSGLAAYFLSKAAFEPLLLAVPGQVSMRMKKFIIASAMARDLPQGADLIVTNGETYTQEEADYRDTLFGLAVSDNP